MILKTEQHTLEFILEDGEEFLPHLFTIEVANAPVNSETWSISILLAASVYMEHRYELQQQGFFQAGTTSVGSDVYVRVKKSVHIEEKESPSMTQAERNSVLTPQERDALDQMNFRIEERRRGRINGNI